ncbi:hypothetical protein WJX77_011488 [Trebouxia sp. C0004]
MNFTSCQSNIAEPAYRQPRRTVSSHQSHPADAVPAGSIEQSYCNLIKVQRRPTVSSARYSGFKGVYKRGGSNRWEVGIEGRGGRRHLSSVGSKEEAIQIYKRVAIKIGHADAEHFCTANPYEDQFLDLHQTPKEELLVPLLWESSVILPTTIETPGTSQMQLQPEHNSQCDRMHPQFEASTALPHCKLPQLQDTLTGFEGLPGSAFHEIKDSALTGVENSHAEGQTHFSGPRAVTKYTPNGLEYTQVITCGPPSVFSLQPCEPMQPYTSSQHESGSCITPAAPLHHLPNVSPRAAHSWQADNSQHAQHSQHAQYLQHAEHSEQANYSQQGDYLQPAQYPQQAEYPQQADYSWYQHQSDAVCQLAAKQPLPPLCGAMHMHALGHKKDSSDLDVAVAPLQMGEEFADSFGTCTVQPCRCSQHDQQEILGVIDAEMEGFCTELLRTDNQKYALMGPACGQPTWIEWKGETPSTSQA